MFFNGGLVPTYLNVKQLGLDNTMGALIFPTLLNTFNLIILRNAFEGIPSDIEEAAVIIAFAVESRKNKPIVEGVDDDVITPPRVFMHPSEEEFASILDMHNIEWEYEPRTFPMEWDVEGNITQAFSPDFYLPRFDTYIELTTMDQRYVSAKKKKVQKLKKLYPGININIVYKKDFYTLAKRFGLGGHN